MTTTPDAAETALHAFDQIAADLERALLRDIQRGETSYARRDGAQRLALGARALAGLRAAVAAGDHAPLLEAVAAGDDAPALLEALRHAVIAARSADPVLALLCDVVAQAAAAEAEARVAAARGYAAQQTTLYKMLLMLGTAADLPDLVDIIVRYVEPMGAAEVRLYVYDSEDGRPAYVRLSGAWRRDGSATAAPAHAPIESQPFRSVMLIDQLITIEDADVDERLDPQTQQGLTESGQLAVISAPLLLDGRPVGRLWVSWGQPRRFSPYELRLIETIAFSVPTMIERLRLMEEAGKRFAEMSFMRDDLERRYVERSAEVQTLRERVMREQLALQEQVIQAQQAALRELSTPLLSLADGVVVMPLVGSIDSARAQEIVEGLLDGVARDHARVAILDITGVPVVDTQVANALLRATQAVKLLGTQAVITGIRPEVAQTLVGLGVNLGGIVTRSTLQSGVAYALQVRR